MGGSLVSYLRYSVLFLGTMVTGEVLRTFSGLNFQSVIPGRVYRSAQPETYQLRTLARSLDLKTVINLRGDDGSERMMDEATASRGLGIGYRGDVNISAKAMPSKELFRSLVGALQESPEPVLIHCWSGADRTGLVAGLYLLLRTDASLEAARAQLTLRYGHVAIGRAKRLGRILLAYEQWLKREDLIHSPEHLCRWAGNVYDPADFNYDLPVKSTAGNG